MFIFFNRRSIGKQIPEISSQKGMNSTLFKLCRNFYLLYPQIGATVSNQFETNPTVLVNNLSFIFYETECMQYNYVERIRRNGNVMKKIFSIYYLGNIDTLPLYLNPFYIKIEKSG